MEISVSGTWRLFIKISKKNILTFSNSVASANHLIQP